MNKDRVIGGYKYELEPKNENDDSKSFYKKAYVLESNNGNKKLLSRTIKVAEIKDGNVYVKQTFNKHTLRHIKEFLKQENFKIDKKVKIHREWKLSDREKLKWMKFRKKGGN